MEDAFRRLQTAVVTVITGTLEVIRIGINFLVKPSTYGMVLIFFVVFLIFEFGQLIFGLAVAYTLIWIGFRIGRDKS